MCKILSRNLLNYKFIFCLCFNVSSRHIYANRFTVSITGLAHLLNSATDMAQLEIGLALTLNVWLLFICLSAVFYSQYCLVIN